MTEHSTNHQAALIYVRRCESSFLRLKCSVNLLINYRYSSTQL